MESTEDAGFVPGIINRPINHELLDFVFSHLYVKSKDKWHLSL